MMGMMMGMMLTSLLQLSALLLKMDDKKREEFCRQESGFIIWWWWCWHRRALLRRHLYVLQTILCVITCLFKVKRPWGWYHLFGCLLPVHHHHHHHHYNHYHRTGERYHEAHKNKYPNIHLISRSSPDARQILMQRNHLRHLRVFKIISSPLPTQQQMLSPRPKTSEGRWLFSEH